MSTLIFIAVIVVLIVVHEFGHFVAAKLSGMQVDEFGLGYPPRALTLGTIGETKYTLNWLPFGGFVKIFGEDGGSGSRSFSSRPRILQAVVLVAGILMNLLFAYVLITGALMFGTPRALSPAEIATATQVELAVANVLPSSPAAEAGIVPGDSIMRASDTNGQWTAADPKSFSTFIAASGGEVVTLEIKQNGKEQSVVATPRTGMIAADPHRFALGVEVATIGIVPLSFWNALTQGAELTWGALTLTAYGLGHFFYGILTFSADLSQVAGPVGIAGVVGSASAQGLGDLFSIMAIISINLALINLIPIPALDGGRLLFVIIESIIRRPIKPRVAQTVNAIGFALLILLMVVVTAHDVFKILH
ncbi:MAG TPA: M50 family metallopeptidase [Candidatus Paceibacterota bacterium]|nr:M50 family metallopeptidase [Candidatus Paceibacterota bacterium]